MASDGDIISDIISRLAESLGADVVPPEVRMRIEAEVRRTWSGNIVYVPACNRPERNAAIRADYRDGLPLDRLAAKYGLTERRIRQIINKRR